MKSAKTCPFFIALAYTGCRTRLVRSPSQPFFQRSQAYGVCSGEEGRLVPQWGVPGNMGRVFWLLFRGLRLPAQGDYTWFQRLLGIC